MNEVVNCAAYLDGRRVANVELNKIGEILQQPNQFLWVGLHEPGEQILEQFQKQLNLHDLAIKMPTMLISGQRLKVTETLFLLFCALHK